MSSYFYKPYKLPNEGKDKDTVHIHYWKDVNDNEKVPGLADFLEKEYESIMYNGGYKNDMGYEKIPVILSNKTPLIEEDATYDNRTKSIMELFKERGDEVTPEEIDKILKGNKVKLRQTGRYYNLDGTGYIEIYFHNFTAETIEEYFEQASFILNTNYILYKLDTIQDAMNQK